MINRKHKSILAVPIALSIIVLAVSVVLAATSFTATQDGYSDGTGGGFLNGATIQVDASESACNEVSIGHIQFDMSTVFVPPGSTSITTADLTLESLFSVQGGATLGLYPSTSGWTEVSGPYPVAANNGVDPTLSTVVVPVIPFGSPQTIVFPSSAALVAHVQDAIDNHSAVVSFIVQWVSGCPGGGNATTAFNDWECSNCGITGGTLPPTLTLNGTGPTAVQVQSVGAKTSWSPIPLMAVVLVLVTLTFGFGGYSVLKERRSKS